LHRPVRKEHGEGNDEQPHAVIEILAKPERDPACDEVANLTRPHSSYKQEKDESAPEWVGDAANRYSGKMQLERKDGEQERRDRSEARSEKLANEKKTGQEA
jgi:hypothetical protein